MSESNGLIASKSVISSSSLAHLKAYPLVSDLLTIFKQYTLYLYITGYLKQAVAFGEPYLAKLPYLSSSLKQLDKFTDNVILTRFDQFFPAITTLTLSDLTPSSIYGKLRSSVSKRVDLVRQFISKRVHSLEDRTKVTLNPIVSPVNNRFESLINNYLPESPKAEASESKDELSRFYLLSTTAYKKSVPMIYSTRDQVTQLPHEISSHISGVYNEELNSSKNSKEAFAKTSRKLSSEAIQSLKPIVDPILKFRDYTKVKIDDSVTKASSTAKNYIDGIVEEVKQGVDAGSITGSSASSAPVPNPVVTASA